jgi:uncharacterized protein (DUF1800 family)
MGGSESGRPRDESRHAVWMRRLHSRRQVHERMFEFWLDHFNIYANISSRVYALWPTWIEMLRARALGNFEQLLVATARHPCMLYYLDNYRSTDGGPNENYARELMELHTLGSMNYQIEGGYIDQDVYEASRCFTGWTIDLDSSSPTRGQFKYVHEDHDRFIKLVLGHIVGGDQPPLRDGMDVLGWLARHPGTARHIATKLARRFVADEPPQSVVDSTAQVFMANADAPDQIARTLRHLFTSAEFLAAKRSKFKRPSEWTASVMRVLRIDYTTSSTLPWIYDPMGQPTFLWRPPDGPPDTADYWNTSSGLLQRWNFVGGILADYYKSSGLEAHLHEEIPADWDTATRVTDWIAWRMIGHGPSSSTHEALVDFIADGRSPDLALPHSQWEAKRRHATALMAMSPEFMAC